jgi:hypothetical protein
VALASLALFTAGPDANQVESWLPLAPEASRAGGF